MRRTALAATAVVALIAGTAPAGALSAAQAPDPAAKPAARNAAAARAGASAAVTLVTGDRVHVGADGRVARIDRGEGREGIVFSVRREGAHTYVVPQDALRLLADGVLDRRLFDVAQLVRDGFGDAHSATLPLIVRYRQGAPVRDTFSGLARDRRPLPAVGGEALTTPKAQAEAFWSRVTGGADALTAGATAATAPVERLWLDGRVRATLDKSVPQIGAPAMWQAGYTGKGITVAVLDTGVDQTHPDLKGVEKAEKNFSNSPDSKDRHGHGTHVASTIGGSGARSGGLYKGVAPGVRILDGKVLGDDGFGNESDIVSGMQWAVDQGAKVVSMSIGGQDGPDVDPKEDAVARLSSKALFVVAAGNDGDKNGTVNSPGSAPAALTVGAVDKQDRLAEFSSRGPTATGVLKPDVTAPGVDITAARTTQGPDGPGDGYLPMSGTSMATPHVSGAAALLFQQHPTWSGARIKALLTASAKPNPKYNALQQGAGRIDLARARTAVVVSSPGSLDFGTHLWPHGDDKPASKTLTYRNHGTKAVTLKLTAAGSDSAGRPAPAGMFTVKNTQLTVPAGGTAQTTVTVDTRKGTADGQFGGSVLAAGDGQSVRTGLAVVREVESYDITLRHRDENGGTPDAYYATLTRTGAGGPGEPIYPEIEEDGTVVQRLAKGTYHLESLVISPGTDNRMAVFVQPVLKVTGKATVTMDASKAKPFAVTPADPAARLVSANVGYDAAGTGVSGSWVVAGSTKFRTAALGPSLPTLRAQYNGVWKVPGAAGRNVDHRLAFNRTGSWFTGLTRTVTKADVAEVRLGFGASVTTAKGVLYASPADEAGYSVGIQESTTTLPAATTQYLSTEGVRWSWIASQNNARNEGRFIFTKGMTAYKPGKRYTLNFNTGVVGPDLAAGTDQEAARTGNYVNAYLQLFNDGAGHSGSSVTTGGFTRLESGGKVLAETGATDWLSTEVPATKAEYRLTKEATRSAADTTTSTKVSAVWTFTSARPAGEETARLPLSTVRLSPALSLRSTAPAGSTLKVPLHVAGAAAGTGRVAVLTVKVSFDGGTTWKPLTVTTDAGGARSVSVKHPASAKAVSFRVYLKDKSGNSVLETITNAYRLAP
ncbi:S8 family peptidase [Streptomyces sp. NPDC101118]|uniref:S8 family peptidase n=1 Tax=Streptomyces sp. NPDC101118 TaxID=3366109 RepID=UPI00380DE3B9